MNTPDEKDEKISDFPDGGLTAWLTASGAQVSVIYITVRPN